MGPIILNLSVPGLSPSCQIEKFKMERKQAAGARKLQWIIVLQIRVVYVGVHVLS